MTGEDFGTLFEGGTLAGGADVLLAGRYRVERELGRGAMGTVYLAEDRTLSGLHVAVKMLPTVLAKDKGAMAALKREALLAHKLSHTNIVTLRHFDETPQGAFLVMDYVEGQTLAEKLLEEGPLSEEKLLETFRPLADALDHAHSEGVVHRDIKPSNVLIRSDGRPMLTDFGVARELKDTVTRLTGLATSGTLPYMSPEQLMGAAPAPAQDVYSLAATMYECLAGHPPFYRGEIAYQIRVAEPAPPPEHPTPLTEGLLRGLAKEPEERPASCHSMLECVPASPAAPALEETPLPSTYTEPPTDPGLPDAEMVDAPAPEAAPRRHRPKRPALRHNAALKRAKTRVRGAAKPSAPPRVEAGGPTISPTYARRIEQEFRAQQRPNGRGLARVLGILFWSLAGALLLYMLLGRVLR